MSEAAKSIRGSGFEIDFIHADQLAGDIQAQTGAVKLAIIHDPVSAIAEAMDVDSALAGMLGTAAALVVPLPFEVSVGRVVTALRVAGIVIGLAVGQPPLAIASLKSLALQKVVETSVKEIAGTPSPAHSNRQISAQRVEERTRVVPLTKIEEIRERLWAEAGERAALENLPWDLDPSGRADPVREPSSRSDRQQWAPHRPNRAEPRASRSRPSCGGR
ncbi:hypothetical protein [Flindersiella endophytica]